MIKNPVFSPKHQSKQGQLFVLEVIISLALIITLIFFIFSIATQNQTILETQEDTMNHVRNNLLQTLHDLRESTVLDAYIYQANQSYYATGSFLSPFQENKSHVITSIETAVTESYQYILKLYRNSSNTWTLIDGIHTDLSPPVGVTSSSLDYYILTINGLPGSTFAIQDSYRIHIIIWEVV